MNEGIPVSYHLDEFHKIVLNLKNIDCKVDDEDHTLIFLCSLPPYFKHFANTMLYGFERNTISIDDIKYA